jgi:tetratricopeptide (TPR) repeat protein
MNRGAHGTSRRSIRLLLILAIVVLAILILAMPRAEAAIENARENIAYGISPTPARAFAYGETHFNASDPADYNINRAQYFFNLAAAKDPSLPYLFHELARISFLRGHFTQAIAQINFQISMHGDSEPNSYYVRGLIEGYMGNYVAAVSDYQHFLQFDPNDWAAINDYAWVLLKDGRAHDAEVATESALTTFPNNPWLLNTNATALFEMGNLKQAQIRAEAAVKAGATITQKQWLTAYPGNDPMVAAEGIATFQNAAIANMHTIALAIASSTVQSKLYHE